MPTPAETQRASQELLLRAMEPALAAAWGLLDSAHMKATQPRFTAAVAALVQQYGRAASTVAARYYAVERARQQVRGRFAVVPTAPPPLDQVDTAVGWATQTLWAPDPDVSAAEVTVLGVVEKLILDTSRSTVLTAVRNDRQARGWARVPDAKACSFCLLLASRGAVYRSERSASFRAHNKCHCHVEALFGDYYEPTALVRHAQAVYQESTKGLHGADARKAFRQAIEGRSPGGTGR